MNKPTRLYDAYIFDLDGTVYLGDALLPNAAAAIQTLRALGKRTVFLSNNPTHSQNACAEKLTRLGLPTSPDDIIVSTAVMVTFLRQTMPRARLFVIGEEPLCNALRDANFSLVENARETDAVIASFDRTFHYRKLQIAFDALRAGARFFATNADRYCPVPGGGEPDAAAIIAAIEACTNTRVEVVVGKPSRYMTDAILDLLQLPASHLLITGDRLETDVQMGLNAGMASALTLTGATTRAELDTAAIRPHFVLESLADLVPADQKTGA
ncbi:MAG: HAD-IIA family hydrolase [Chloroflexi bacterium]|nr:HAD-IIA family hydrolase [Chloroflexota bacterium]MBI4761763.1 HAD-IIA family hydrolase [Chloroflexota bacterium]